MREIVREFSLMLSSWQSRTMELWNQIYYKVIGSTLFGKKDTIYDKRETQQASVRICRGAIIKLINGKDTAVKDIRC